MSSRDTSELGEPSSPDQSNFHPFMCRSNKIATLLMCRTNLQPWHAQRIFGFMPLRFWAEKSTKDKRTLLPFRKYIGIWGADPSTSSSGYEYRLELDFSPGGKTSVKLDAQPCSSRTWPISGPLVWTLLKAPPSLAMHFKDKLNCSAQEIVEGTYDPATRALEFVGVRLVDKHGIIGKDNYRMMFSADGQIISGVTKTHHGTWKAKVELSAELTKKPPIHGHFSGVWVFRSPGQPDSRVSQARYRLSLDFATVTWSPDDKALHGHWRWSFLGGTGGILADLKVGASCTEYWSGTYCATTRRIALAGHSRPLSDGGCFAFPTNMQSLEATVSLDGLTIVGSGSSNCYEHVDNFMLSKT